MIPESADERADRLALVAMGLAVRIRDDDPEANGRWLDAHVRDLEDLRALVFVACSAIPVDVPWSHLTAWARLPGGADTPEAIAQRRKDLNEAMKGGRGRRRAAVNERPPRHTHGADSDDGTDRLDAA